MYDLLDEYKIHLTESGVSKSTYDAYIRDVTTFLSYVDISVSHDIKDVKTEDLMGFEKALEKSGKTPSTVNRCIAGVKKFYKFLRLNGMDIEDPTEELRSFKVEKKLPTILSNREIDRLLKAPESDTPKGCRDKAMLEVLYATGMRVSEIINLNLGDFQLNSGLICCHSGGTNRVIPIYDEAKKALRDYLLRVYPFYSKKDTDALFINMNGNRLTRQGFWKIVKYYVDEIGLKGDITPHTLRHSFAAHLIENGASVEDVKEMLGHSDIASTQVYAQIVQNKFVDTYKRCHPRAMSKAR